MKRILLELIIRAYQRMRATKACEKYLFAIVILLSVAVNGCSIDVRMGRRPDVQVIEKNLRLQESTSRDVLAVLGEHSEKGSDASWFSLNTQNNVELLLRRSEFEGRSWDISLRVF